MAKKVTLKKLKELKVEAYLDKNGFAGWRYTNAPKELVPTENDIGRLVKLAREPGTRDTYSNYKIRGFTRDKQNNIIVELLGDKGFASRRIEEVVLSNQKLTKEEKLIQEHEEKQ